MATPAPVGYSGTPLPQKLGIGAGSRVRFIRPPAGFAHSLGELPPGVEQECRDRADLVVWFTDARAELERDFDATAATLVPAGMLWIAWPKKASRVPTDLSEDVIREIALAHAMVDVKVCAIDAVWSGLKLVYRVKDRPPARASTA